MKYSEKKNGNLKEDIIETYLFDEKDIPSFHEKLNCVIDRISVERIGENGESIIEFEVPLQKS